MEADSQTNLSLWEALTANNAADASRDPIECLNKATLYFGELVRDHDYASDGHQERLYEFLQACYWVGQFYTQNNFAYRQFKLLDFWRHSRQKPKGKLNIMKWVVYFAMRALSKRMRDRAGKYWKVLDSFLNDDVAADAVARKLKAGGGVDRLYAELCDRVREDEAKRDDLELLRAAPSRLVRSADDEIGDERLDAHQGTPQAPFADDHPGESTAASVRSENLKIADHVPREPVALLQAADEWSDVIADDNQKVAKRGPLSRIDLDLNLAIDMRRREIDQVGAAKWVTIVAKVESPDERGWFRVVAHSVSPSYNSEQP